MKASADSIEATQRRKLVQHQQQLVPARDAIAAVERFGQPPPDLVQDEPDQRLGAAYVGGRHHQIERYRVLGGNQVGDAPIAARCDFGHGRVAVQAEKRHGGGEHARSLVVRLVEHFAGGSGCDNRVSASPRCFVVIIRCSVSSNGHAGSLRKLATPRSCPRLRTEHARLHRPVARGWSSPNDCASLTHLQGQPECRRCSARRALHVRRAGLQAAGCRRPTAYRWG